MVLGCALLTLNDASLKWLATDLPVGQVLFMRGCFALVVIVLVAAWSGGFGQLRIRSFGNQLLRAALTVASTFVFVTGLRFLPLADAIAITFAGPLFLTTFAALLLGERVRWRRWTAVSAGFVGVLVMIRPSGDGLNWAALLPLFASLGGALRDILTRRMSVNETSLSTLGFTTLAVTLAGLCTAPLGWQPVPGTSLALLAATSVLIAGAHFLLIETYRLAEASLVAPFKYSSFVWATLFGLLIWGELPSGWVVLGGAIVIASGLYIFQRER